MILFKKKISPEQAKEEIIRLIDENTVTIYKAAFYSNEKVGEIMNLIMERWEKAGRRDRPIDHASNEEIMILYKIAREITRRRPEELLAENPDLAYIG